MLDTGNGLKLAAAAASGAIATLLFSNIKSKPQENVPEKWIRVGKVKELILYPIKSCKGIRVDEATITKVGLKGSDYLRDRVFMIMEMVNGKSVFQTQRQIPKMVLIQATVNENQLTLRTDNDSPIVIDIPEYSPNLERSCRLFW